MTAPAPQRSGRAPGSEARRALIGVLLGVGLGLLVVVFSKREG